MDARTHNNFKKLIDNYSDQRIFLSDDEFKTRNEFFAETGAKWLINPKTGQAWQNRHGNDAFYINDAGTYSLFVKNNSTKTYELVSQLVIVENAFIKIYTLNTPTLVSYKRFKSFLTDVIECEFTITLDFLIANQLKLINIATGEALPDLF